MVNFHQSKLCAVALKTLIEYNLNDLIREGISLHIHWIDNEAAEHDRAREDIASFVQSRAAEYAPEHLVWHLHCFSENLGFGGACQKIYEQLPVSDYLLLLNPDTKLYGLKAMLASLHQEGHKAAGVGPQSFWDDDFSFFLPPTPLIDAHFIALESMAQSLPLVAQQRSRWFRSRSRAIWEARQAIRVEALSGACALLRIDALQACGGLFDLRYFMYWEDSDLMMRLHQHQFKLYIEPDAKLVHAYTHHPAKSAMIDEGRKHYVKKWGIADWWNPSLWHSACQPEAMQTQTITPGSDLLMVSTVNIGECLWELSLSRDFVPSIGRFCKDFHLPWSLLQSIASVPCFVRQITPQSDNCWAIKLSL